MLSKNKKHNYEIFVKNQHFIVHTNSTEAKIITSKFKKNFITYSKVPVPGGHGRMKSIVSRIFTGGNELLGEFRFNINTLKDYFIHLRDNGVKSEDVSVIKNDNVEKETIDISIRPGKKDRDYQTKYINALIDDTDIKAKLVDLQTGMGKTRIACRALSELKKRTAVIVLPKYIEKWIGDLKENMLIDDENIMVIQGSADLTKLMNLSINGDHIPEFIIFSNRTLYIYIKKYEAVVDRSLFPYPLLPGELLDKLNVDVVLVDEVHQEFYSVFKTMLYFDPKLLIGLSATLVTNDIKLKAMYNTLFVKAGRLSLLDYDKYIVVRSIEYNISRMHGIKYDAPGGRGYSHLAFEKSIMRNNRLLNSYFDMILYYVKEEYIKRKKKGQKLMIFAATIDMCTLLTKRISKEYPKLDVRRYVGDDPYENVIEPDIRVSTIKSSGTAIDIPNLINVIQTVSIASEQANLQSVGRLRKISGVEVRFIYFWSPQIKRQMSNHFNLMNMLKDKTKKYELDRYTNGDVTC